jgi:hypothetical protein
MKKYPIVIITCAIVFIVTGMMLVQWLQENVAEANCSAFLGSNAWPSITTTPVSPGTYKIGVDTMLIDKVPAGYRLIVHSNYQFPINTSPAVPIAFLIPVHRRALEIIGSDKYMTLWSDGRTGLIDSGEALSDIESWIRR